MISDHLKILISELPTNPGIYQFFDKDNKLLYIGKAKNLKKRVSSYFTKNHESWKTKILVSKISDIKHLFVENETDALLLENNLIKKHQPRYNILLKDDKTFPWICVKNENFPRIYSTRNIVKDGSQYFGPYTSIKMVNILLSLIKKLYKIRTCKLNLSLNNIQNGKFKKCLEYDIGNCEAPCINLQCEQSYNKNVEQITSILKGDLSSVLVHLKKQMYEFAETLDFEDANRIKQKIELLENYKSKSTIVSSSLNNIDIFSILDDDKYAYVNFLKIINGAIIQTHTTEIKKKLSETKEEILKYAIIDIRQKFFSTSKEVIVPFNPNINIDGLFFTVPIKGDKKKLLDLSVRNVMYYKQSMLNQKNKLDPNRHTNRILNKMKYDLNLSEKPVHIECFDNSNIQGQFPVASCVVFRDAKPYKKDYRHYNIKTVEGANDFASMEEIIYRRYKRLLDEKESLPQLIIVDGGKGQISSAVNSLRKLGLYGEIQIIGIAKRLEEIFLPEDPIPIYLDKTTETLKVIQHLRNEAHRFGIKFHRLKRSENFITSELNNIKGIGNKTIESLLSKFKTIEKIKQINTEEMSKTIGKAKSKIVWNYFNNEKEN